MKTNWILPLMFTSIVAVACSQANAATATTSSTITNTQTTQQQTMTTGEKFLQENKTQPGVITLPSGLQYKVLEAGGGKKPLSTDKVTVDYEGTLINGKVFDSSYKRGQPATFPVNAVIPGWQQALPLMSTGSTWMLYIPSNLAYGAHGAGPDIGPNETLVFKVHLISIQ